MWTRRIRSTSTSSLQPPQCSFCGISKVRVRNMIAGPDGLMICDLCVEQCVAIITKNNAGPGHELAPEFAPLPTISSGDVITREHAVALDAYRRSCGKTPWIRRPAGSAPLPAAVEINEAVGWWNAWLAQEQEGDDTMPDVHEYVSTACQHQLHERCRDVCKFCGANCRCVCHGDRPGFNDTALREALAAGLAGVEGRDEVVERVLDVLRAVPPGDACT